MIFEASLAFRKSDVVLLQELPTKQFVRRQTVHDRRIADGAAANRSGKDHAGNATLQPRHPWQHNVRATTSRKLIEPFQRLGAEPVVVITEEDILATSGVEAHIPRLPRPAGIGLVNHSKVGVDVSKLIEECWGLISGAVINADDLEFIG